MKNYTTKSATIAFFFAAILASGCGKSGPSGPSFEELIDQGWLAFAQKDYATAIQRFSDAQAMDAARIEPYEGLGWSYFLSGQLDQASVQFASGETQSEPTADLYAGWAFALNAMKNYSLSNVRADQALELDPQWSFSHGLPLDAEDLHILKAENYFVSGDFQKALEEVQAVDPGFSADLNSEAGLAALAQKIEFLRTGG